MRETERLHQLFERLGALFRASLRRVASQHGLKLVQLESLIYLAQANRYSDTPVALTEYLGVTKGTVSQTLMALERHGLIVKQPDAEDRRVLHCRPTPAGEDVVAAAYPDPTFEVLEEDGARPLADGLEDVLRTLQRSQGHRTFGICASCRHFQPRARGGRCGLTSESLTRLDTTRLCREHAPNAGES